MKHLRLFENINDIPTFETRLHSLNVDIDNYYWSLVPYIEKDIDMQETQICNDFGGYLVNFTIHKINKQGILIVINNDECNFEDMHTDSKIVILNELMKELNKTYKYQKEIITKEPSRISEIIKKLHPDIKKEFPHLGSGKDLNLL